MKLSSVSIQNFRSIRSVEFSIRELTTLIGRNAAGKSNLLYAIRAFFTFSDKSFTETDICDHADDDEDTWIECTFDELTETEQSALGKYVLPDGTARIRRTITNNQGRILSRLQGWTAMPAAAWLKSDFTEYSDDDFWNGLGVNPRDYAAPSKSGKITREVHSEFCKNYIERNRDEIEFETLLSDTEMKGRQSTAANVLPLLTFVPAMGDVTSEIVGKSTSMMNIIVAGLLGEANTHPHYEAATSALADAGNLINPSASRLAKLSSVEEQLQSQLAGWGQVGCQIRCDVPDVEKVLLLGLGIDITLDGHSCDLASQGDGIQRQVLFQVFRLYADYRTARGVFEREEPDPESQRSHIIVFEEPELFLHPQAQERFLDDLVRVSSVDQVLVSTHSNHLIDLEHTDGLVIVQKEGEPRHTVVRIASDEWANNRDERRKFKDWSLVNRDMAKMFFADKIVLVEGRTEYVCLAGAAVRHCGCFDRRVAIVPVNGKPSMPGFQAILNGFGIPYVAVFDVDPGNEESARHTVRIVEKVREARTLGSSAGVCPMNPDLPTVAGIDEGARDKEYGAFQHIQTNEPPAEFLAEVERVFDLEWFGNDP